MCGTMTKKDYSNIRYSIIAKRSKKLMNHSMDYGGPVQTMKVMSKLQNLEPWKCNNEAMIVFSYYISLNVLVISSYKLRRELSDHRQVVKSSNLVHLFSEK